MHLPLLTTPRARFIARDGILRRGTAVGAVIALAYAILNRTGFATNARQQCLLVLLCFIEWTLGTGWLIGAMLWSWRQQAGHSSVWPRSPRNEDQNRR